MQIPTDRAHGDIWADAIRASNRRYTFERRLSRYGGYAVMAGALAALILGSFLLLH